MDWANQSLSGMILFIDRVKQSNYLKSGTLSGPVITQLDKLSQQINVHIELSHLDNLEKVKSTSDFTELRVKQIHQAQQDIVVHMNQANASREASSQFFSILTEKYKGRNFADIQESDRQILRTLYAQMQEGMAHVNLELDAKLVEVLNQTGPDTIPPQGYLSWGVNWVKNSEIDNLIKQEEQVDDFYLSQFRSEDYKLCVHENELEVGRKEFEREEQEESTYLSKDDSQEVTSPTA